MNNREKQLLDLGFEKNDHQKCFSKWKYNCSWITDFWDLEVLSDERWNIHIENYKKYLKEAKIELENDELYLLGEKSAEKRIEQQPKLIKTVNKERILIISSKIDVLEELKNKIYGQSN